MYICRYISLQGCMSLTLQTYLLGGTCQPHNSRSHTHTHTGGGEWANRASEALTTDPSTGPTRSALAKRRQSKEREDHTYVYVHRTTPRKGPMNSKCCTQAERKVGSL